MRQITEIGDSLDLLKEVGAVSEEEKIIGGPTICCSWYVEILPSLYDANDDDRTLDDVLSAGLDEYYPYKYYTWVSYFTFICDLNFILKLAAYNIIQSMLAQAKMPIILISRILLLTQIVRRPAPMLKLRTTILIKYDSRKLRWMADRWGYKSSKPKCSRSPH